jgi:tetratricopeptide (TPR) repeat protein
VALCIFERNFLKGEAEFLEVLQVKPTLTFVYLLLAMLYNALGRFDDAAAMLTHGHRVDPLWPVLPATEVSVRFFSRDFDAAVECGKRGVEMHPYVLMGRSYYAQALEQSGQIEAALREYRLACMMFPGFVWLRSLEARCLARSGRQSEARGILEEITAIRDTEYVDAYYLALLYDALDSQDLAFEELERACEEKSIALCLLDVDPKMDSLRGDPRFARLRKRVLG